MLEGPPGVGKTEIAKLWAGYHDAELIRLQCYEGLDEAKALYEWSYGKQMLYAQLLRDKTGDVLSRAPDLKSAIATLRDEADGFFSRDFLLTIVTLYWVTGTITSSMRDYFDNRWHGHSIGPEAFVRVPTAFASFPRQFAFEGDPPREWVERLYNVRRWTRMERGGHFAAAEEPELLAGDIAGFFGSL